MTRSECWSIQAGTVEILWMFWNFMRRYGWTSCYATADLSGCPIRLYRWCSFFLVCRYLSWEGLVFAPWGMILPQITHPLQECGTATPLPYLRRTFRIAQQYATMPCTCSIPKGRLRRVPWRHQTHRSRYVFRALSFRAPSLAVVCTLTDLRMLLDVVMSIFAWLRRSTVKPKDVGFLMLKIQWLYIVINYMFI